MDHNEIKLLPQFVPSSELIRTFQRAVNGNRLEHHLRKLGGMDYTKAIVVDLLAGVVDDALVSFFLIDPRQRNHSRGCLYREENYSNILVLAIKERLPLASSSPEQIENVARQVVDEIREQLKNPQTRLAVGTGAVWVRSGEWRAQGLEPL